MNRRYFLGQTFGHTAAATLFASPKIRVGMIGTGHSHFAGKQKVLRENPAYDLVGVAEFPEADKLLNDSSVQLIVVECRVWEAVPWGAKVIAAGKHLHLEKPPGNEFGAFKELVEEARRKKLLIQTGYLWRWHPGVMAAIEAAQKGWLGEVFMVRGTINSDRGPEERTVEGRYKGGGLFELSGHLIDRIVELMGRPKTVKSWLRHDTSVPDKLADNNLAVFEYDRALAVISQAAKMSGAGDHRSIELIGTEGTILVHPESNPPRMRVHVRTARGPYKAGWQDLALAPQPRFVADFAELARAIQTGSPLKHSYDHELLLQETLLRASGEIA